MYKQLFIISYQRCASVEQGYNELHGKYNDISSQKASLEKQVLSLQHDLDDEKHARSHGSDHIQALESK